MEILGDIYPKENVLLVIAWNKLYKRSIVTENRLTFPDIRRCQDATFNIDFFNCIGSAASIDRAYYHYMENTAGDEQRKFRKDYIEILLFYYQRLIGILSSWGMYTGEIKMHFDTTVAIVVFDAMRMFDNPLWSLSKEEQKQYVLDIMNRSEVHQLLDHADIRDDAVWKYRIIRDRDYPAFMRYCRKEKRKNSFRQNKLLRDLYQRIKGTG